MSGPSYASCTPVPPSGGTTPEYTTFCLLPPSTFLLPPSSFLPPPFLLPPSPFLLPPSPFPLTPSPHLPPSFSPFHLPSSPYSEVQPRLWWDRLLGSDGSRGDRRSVHKTRSSLPSQWGPAHRLRQGDTSTGDTRSVRPRHVSRDSNHRGSTPSVWVHGPGRLQSCLGTGPRPTPGARPGRSARHGSRGFRTGRRRGEGGDCTTHCSPQHPRFGHYRRPRVDRHTDPERDTRPSREGGRARLAPKLRL